ncbi:hypothetical protein LEP1GSC195_3879 [Leptospira wolbachii serovar Codice str. CDC]|uniref:Uncharacterized protein n=1 Tax=Leptospira wolbachii serovar Codice str. CDC TaxID=1218599 RepID=R9A1N8_9LEPT|nr:hypothetical protein [Leptospira wolbachii]EOQ95894.1 hypothetical protein LEP1GSC195_3879 [Leptospira wolbachii serovar Codice str. CDC]
MWKISNIYILTIVFLQLNCFPSCQPEKAELSPELLTVLLLTTENRRYSFEPNDTKESAFCIDVPARNYVSAFNAFQFEMMSVIFPRNDTDYYRIFFKNQKFGLDHALSASAKFHIILENESEIIYDSRNPENSNSFIETNEILNFVFQNQSYSSRRVILNGLNSAYLKLIHNENLQFPEGYSNDYVIDIIDKTPNNTDEISRGNIRILGEFLSCPH